MKKQMERKEETSSQEESSKKMPDKVGVGHARFHQKMLDNAKRKWKGGGC